MQTKFAKNNGKMLFSIRPWSANLLVLRPIIDHLFSFPTILIRSLPFCLNWSSLSLIVIRRRMFWIPISLFVLELKRDHVLRAKALMSQAWASLSLQKVFESHIRAYAVALNTKLPRSPLNIMTAITKPDPTLRFSQNYINQTLRLGLFKVSLRFSPSLWNKTWTRSYKTIPA